MSALTYEVDPQFQALVTDRLDVIEARLLDAARADVDFVTEAATHIIAAGGKRFRPLLVVLASQLLPGADADRIDRAASRDGKRGGVRALPKGNVRLKRRRLRTRRWRSTSRR